ncbi:hypothetical protein D3C80_1054430 [compost metagenome]
MVAIDGGGPAHQGLDQALDVGGLEQVQAAHDVGDALQGVVVGHGQMIGGPGVLARQHHVAGRFRFGADQAGLAFGAFALLDKGKRVPGLFAQGLARPVQRQPPGIGAALSQQAGFFLRRVGTGPDGLGGTVRGVADGVEDFLPCAEATIEQAVRVQGLDDSGVVGQVIRLAAHRRLPVETEPGEVLKNGRLELRLAAGRVDVLDTQDEAPAHVARRRPGGQGRKGVALVQAAGGRGGEAGGEHGGSLEPDRLRWNRFAIPPTP